MNNQITNGMILRSFVRLLTLTNAEGRGVRSEYGGLAIGFENHYEIFIPVPVNNDLDEYIGNIISYIRKFQSHIRFATKTFELPLVNAGDTVKYDGICLRGIREYNPNDDTTTIRVDCAWL